MTDNATLSALHHYVDQARWISPCVEVVALTTHALGDCAAAYENAYTRFEQRWGQQLTWWRTNAMKQMRRWDARAASMLPFWMQDDVSLAQGMIGLTAQAGPPKPACAPPMLDFYHEQLTGSHGGIRFALPADMANAPDALLELVREALGDFPFSYGYAGFSLCWHPDSYDAQRAMSGYAPRWLPRHPGLGLGDMLPFALTSELGLFNVSWLTILGQNARKTLEQQHPVSVWPASVTLHELASGALVIQASARPELGDVNRSDRLDSYRSVAQLLAPLWAPDAALSQINLMVLQDDAKERWLKRFLEASP